MKCKLDNMMEAEWNRINKKWLKARRKCDRAELELTWSQRDLGEAWDEREKVLDKLKEYDRNKAAQQSN